MASTDFHPSQHAEQKLAFLSHVFFTLLIIVRSANSLRDVAVGSFAVIL